MNVRKTMIAAAVSAAFGISGAAVAQQEQQRAAVIQDSKAAELPGEIADYFAGDACQGPCMTLEPMAGGYSLAIREPGSRDIAHWVAINLDEEVVLMEPGTVIGIFPARMPDDDGLASQTPNPPTTDFTGTIIQTHDLFDAGGNLVGQEIVSFTFSGGNLTSVDTMTVEFEEH